MEKKEKRKDGKEMDLGVNYTVSLRSKSYLSAKNNPLFTDFFVLY